MDLILHRFGSHLTDVAMPNIDDLQRNILRQEFLRGLFGRQDLEHLLANHCLERGGGGLQDGPFDQHPTITSLIIVPPGQEDAQNCFTRVRFFVINVFSEHVAEVLNARDQVRRHEAGRSGINMLHEELLMFEDLDAIHPS